MSTTATMSTPPPSTESMLCRQCQARLDLGANYCPICGAPSQGDAAPDPLVGQIVADRYRIIQLIGRGGMGVVYKCEHARMGKLMAIKLLHGELARDQEIQRRFRREAQTISKLSHPCTVGIFDFGTSDGLMYLAMEYVSGDDLGKVLRAQTTLPPPRVAAFAAQACGSLSEAHELGIVHRDLKPENLIVTRLRDGREMIKLLDFGLAKLREGEERNEITSNNTLVGTPYYMAPEIIRGQAIDHRADIYALGAVIYRGVTGVPAFSGSSPVAVLTRHLTDDLVPPSKRKPDLDLPPEIDEIVVRCMAKDPRDRYQNVDEVREALSAFVAASGSENLLIDSEIVPASALRSGTARRSSLETAKFSVATRSDVEAFERRLRRGKILAWVSIVLLIAVAGGAGLFFYRHATRAATAARDREIEPNQSAAQATPIASGTVVHGQLARRLSREQGDVDLYRLTSVGASGGRIRVELNAQPNIDTVVELLRAGQPEAVFVADDGAEGGREVIAGFRVAPGQYFISVHERVRPGAIPQENVSDDYTIRYTIGPSPSTEEIEPDDRREVANDVANTGTVAGYIESRGDVDWYCLRSAPASLRVSVTPPSDLDVELTITPRDGTGDVTVDEGRDGIGESRTIATAAGARAPCVVVRASSAHPPEHGNPDRTYTLRFEAP